jgi:hypothetical protein
MPFVPLVAGRRERFSAQARTAGPIDKSLSVTTRPTKGVDRAGNGLLKAKQPLGGMVRAPRPTQGVAEYS